MLSRVDIKQMIKANNGMLPETSSIGGYTLTYIDMDGRILCPTSANKDHDNIEKAFIHFEGEPFICDECNVEIPSEYGVPEE